MNLFGCSSVSLLGLINLSSFLQLLLRKSSLSAQIEVLGLKVNFSLNLNKSYNCSDRL